MWCMAIRAVVMRLRQEDHELKGYTVRVYIRYCVDGSRTVMNMFTDDTKTVLEVAI